MTAADDEGSAAEEEEEEEAVTDCFSCVCGEGVVSGGTLVLSLLPLPERMGEMCRGMASCNCCWWWEEETAKECGLHVKES